MTSFFINLDFKGSSLKNCLRSFTVFKLDFRLSKSLGEIDPCPNRDNNRSTSWKPFKISLISLRLSVFSNNSCTASCLSFIRSKSCKGRSNQSFILREPPAVELLFRTANRVSLDESLIVRTISKFLRVTASNVIVLALTIREGGLRCGKSLN